MITRKMVSELRKHPELAVAWVEQICDTLDAALLVVEKTKKLLKARSFGTLLEIVGKDIDGHPLNREGHAIMELESSLEPFTDPQDTEK